jgi:hypothetical protein
MFNLEEQIKAWRSELVCRGIKRPEVLDELESHLREQIDQLKSSDEEAFRAAVRQLGESKDLKREFSKVSRNRWFFRENPIALNVLAAWFLIMGLDHLVTFFRFGLLNGFFFSNFANLFSIKMITIMLTGGGTVIGLLFLPIGIGLLRRRNFWRTCALAFFALRFAGEIAAFIYLGHLSPIYRYAPFIPPPGETAHYGFMGLSVPYGVFYAIPLINLAVIFVGWYILTRPSIRNLFHPASTQAEQYA